MSPLLISLGSILLVVGALTRFACLIQIPILLGAIFLVNLSPPDFYRPHAELALSILVLLLLILVPGDREWPVVLSSASFKEEERTS